MLKSLKITLVLVIFCKVFCHILQQFKDLSIYVKVKKSDFQLWYFQSYDVINLSERITGVEK